MVVFISPTSSMVPRTLSFRMFVVQQIPDSNLVLVVTQADCDCSRQYGPILLTPKEIKYILISLSVSWFLSCDTCLHWHWESGMLYFLSNIKHNATVKCNRMKSQKVRRRPGSCHSYHPKVRSCHTYTHNMHYRVIVMLALVVPFLIMYRMVAEL